MNMTRADELRELARQLVEGVMMSDENFSAEFLQGVHADVHRLEMEACELDEQSKKSRQLSDD